MQQKQVRKLSMTQAGKQNAITGTEGKYLLTLKCTDFVSHG
jgi:hypothetical protein